MGTDPGTSAIGPDNETHEVKGLFVADASAFPSAAPSIRAGRPGRPQPPPAPRHGRLRRLRRAGPPMDGNDPGSVFVRVPSPGRRLGRAVRDGPRPPRPGFGRDALGLGEAASGSHGPVRRPRRVRDRAPGSNERSSDGRGRRDPPRSVQAEGRGRADDRPGPDLCGEGHGGGRSEGDLHPAYPAAVLSAHRRGARAMGGGPPRSPITRWGAAAWEPTRAPPPSARTTRPMR